MFNAVLLFSSLPMVQPSHAYVIIGIMMASTICHIACIFIPLNSLLPVSEMILAVAPFIFLSISAIWSDRLPLLFRVSPRYLYAGTSSSSSPFSFRELFFPFPLFISLLSRMREQGVQFTSRLWPCNSLSWLKAMGTATAQHIWCVHTTSGWCMYVNFSELLRE